MAEGDTLLRTADTLGRWLIGQRITAARGRGRVEEGVQRLVGETVEAVDARGKHLLVRCTAGLMLHTHMKMTGSWHVYQRGERWKRPERQAVVVLEARDRIAVCFNAPVVEVLDDRGEAEHPTLTRLGPDVLATELDVGEIERRARRQPPDRPVADVLLDQSVVCGIGNIWRAEALHAAGVDPATPIGELGEGVLAAVVGAARRMMLEPVRRKARVYRRVGRPCARCGASIRSARFENGRWVYWCARCQRRPA